jgi:hypothetical protein
MKFSKPILLIECIFICSFIPYVSAGIHYCLISARVLKIPLCILNSNGGVFKNLINIWSTQFVRRIISVCVRSPLRPSMLRMVNLLVPLRADSGCIIAICHTPWKRLLVQWCLENNFALIMASGKWTHRKRRIQREVEGFSDLRQIVKSLQQNGRIIIAFDVFNNLNNCPVNFFGNCCNVSLLPARLARIAKVPLFTAIPTLRNGVINIDFGPEFDLHHLNSDSSGVMKNIILFLESELKNNPGVWPTNYYHNLA